MHIAATAPFSPTDLVYRERLSPSLWTLLSAAVLAPMVALVFVPLDPNKTYGVVANDYTRRGGDGYDVFAKKAINPYDFGPSLENTVADYLTAHNPYKPYTDGRVKGVETAAATAPATPETKTAETPAATTETKPAETQAKPADTAVAESPATQAATAPTSHVVVKGDTLWDLAVKFYGNGEAWKTISSANGKPNPKKLAIGEALEIPAK